MFLGGGLISQYASPVTVQLPAIVCANTVNPPSSIAYSGLRFDNDGQIYRMSGGGAWNATATWLLDGAASSFYLFRTVDTGSLTNDDGDGTQMNTADIDFWVSTTTEWFTKTAKVTFNITSDAGGSNVLATRQYTFSATLNGSGEPP